jgi:hypothetical protein
VERVLAVMGPLTEAGAETFSFSPDSEMPEIGVGFSVEAERLADAWGFAPWVVELLGDIAGPAEVISLRVCDDDQWRSETERSAEKRGVLSRLWPPCRQPIWAGRPPDLARHLDSYRRNEHRRLLGPLPPHS